MEKIVFDNSTIIYTIKFDLSDIKEELLKDCQRIVDNKPEVIHDNYGYSVVWDNDISFQGVVHENNKLDKIMNLGIKLCKDLHTENINKPYNTINADAWVNIVRATNPRQPNFLAKNEIQFHTHTVLNSESKSFRPDYTFVYYIQMPDNLVNDDGVLYIEGENKTVHKYLPTEEEFVIMASHLPHVPASARRSTKDRIVFAGNVGFEFIKNQQSLI